MKINWLSAVIVGAMAQLVSLPAFAADLPPSPTTFKAAAMAPGYDWSGFYAGLNGGGGWGSSNANVTFDPTSTDSTAAAGPAPRNLTGGFGGLQAGYNLQ